MDVEAKGDVEREILAIVVFWMAFLGGDFLQFSVHEFLSFDERDDPLMPVQPSPFPLS